MLGSRLEQAGSPAYARQPELLAHLFERAQLDPACFLGYRCETPYPIWRTGYRVTLDFGSANSE